LESAQELLKDLLRKHDKRLNIEDIQKRVAEHYGIRTSEMHSAKRIRSVALPRQVAMYLSKTLTPFSLPEIGRKFGGRDHTTVIHAIKKIQGLKTQDPGFSYDLDLLMKILES
jgi:chromosomal replication initiator protein